MKVYYVAGYGRSGSTLLARLAGRQHGAVVIGEAHVLASGIYLNTAICSCGELFPMCAYWASFDAEMARCGEVGVSQSRRRWLEGPAGLLVPMFLLRRWVTRAAFSTRYRIPYSAGVRALATVSGGSFVDTSKTTRLTANRARLLAAAGLEVDLYVAKRTLAEVVPSYHSGRKRFGLVSSRIRSWIVVPWSRMAAHLAARWSAFSLRRPINWIGLDQAAAEVVNKDTGGSHLEHLIAGNRMRHQGLKASPPAR